MSHKRGLSPEVWKQKTRALEDWLYKNGFEEKFEQMTQYQWRIRIPGKGYVDIYPGTQKYWKPVMKQSERYENLEELKKVLI